MLFRSRCRRRRELLVQLSLPDFNLSLTRLPSTLLSLTKLISFVVWLLVNRFVKDMSTSASAVSSLTFGLSVLIVSCPCAIALAVSSLLTLRRDLVSSEASSDASLSFCSLFTFFRFPSSFRPP